MGTVYRRSTPLCGWWKLAANGRLHGATGTVLLVRRPDGQAAQIEAGVARPDGQARGVGRLQQFELHLLQRHLARAHPALRLGFLLNHGLRRWRRAKTGQVDGGVVFFISHFCTSGLWLVLAVERAEICPLCTGEYCLSLVHKTKARLLESGSW